MYLRIMFTLRFRIAEHARLFINLKKSILLMLIKACSLINFPKKILPAWLFSPARLLITLSWKFQLGFFSDVFWNFLIFFDCFWIFQIFSEFFRCFFWYDHSQFFIISTCLVILVCLIIILPEIFHPARLFWPARLLIFWNFSTLLDY